MAKRENMGTGFEPGTVERIAGAIRYMFTGEKPVWFGPMDPLPPIVSEQEKPSVEGRQFDYPVGFNQRTQPRSGESVSFSQMRALADGYDLLRVVIETRKDQVEKLRWMIKPKDENVEPDSRCAEIEAFFRSPDKEHTWTEWLRMILEDLFVIDAPAVYVRPTIGGQIYALEPVDGATIKRVIDEHGRTPRPPLPAFQQILKGVPAVDYTLDELIYKPRNLRTHKVYGYSPVEQIIMTVNIALRRQMNQLSYYTEGNVPNTIFRVPKEWQPDQIKQFQTFWDELTTGQSKHVGRFIPEGPEPIDTKAQALKDDFDEWLARIICFCFSISPTPFIKQQNRATADNATEQAMQEGLAPIMNWVKSFHDGIIAKWFGADDIEFSWREEKAIDPLEQSEVHKNYADAKILTKDEIRADLGRAPLTPAQKEELTPVQMALPLEGGGNQPEKPGKKGEPVNPDDDQDDDAAPKEAAAVKKKSVAAVPEIGTIDRDRKEVADLSDDLLDVVSAFLKEKGDDIAAQLTGPIVEEKMGKDDLDLDSIDFSSWDEIVEEVTTIIQGIAVSGAVIAQTQIGGIESQAVKQANEEAIKWASDRAAEWVGKTRLPDGSLIENPNVKWRIDDTTREMLRGTVQDAIENGWSNERLAKEIKESPAFSKARAEMIARTETAMADIQGSMATYRASGIVKKKRWLVGAFCCEACQSMAGQEVGLNENFKGGIGAPPLHPHCRCDVVPVLK